MKRIAQTRTLRLTGLLAAIITVACVGLLMVDYIQACRKAPLDSQRLIALGKTAKEDPARTTALQEERDRQRDASLERTARAERVAYILIVAVTALIVCAKWLIAVQARRAPTPDKICSATPGLRRPPRGPDPRAAGFPGAPEPADSTPPRAVGFSPRGHPRKLKPAAQDDLSFVDDIIRRSGGGQEAVIPILQAIQTRQRYLPQAALKRVCERTDITPAQITGVSSFYKRFRQTPVGRHLLKVCHGTACHVAGAPTLTDEIRRQLGIGPDTDTDPQRLFTIEEVACLGCCTLAPVVQADGVTHGHLTHDMVSDVLDDCRCAERNGSARPRRVALAHAGDGDTPLGEIRIGLGSCCVAGGSDGVYQALELAVADAGGGVAIKRVGCVGMCHQIPLVEAVVPGRTSSLYARVTAEDARSIVRRHFPTRRLRRRITNAASSMIDGILRNGTRVPITHRSIEVRDPPVVAFLGRQKHIATEHYGEIDPTDLDEYLLHDGFKALKRCVRRLTPKEIIEETRRSQLRGRGGAGFPTGKKWARVYAADAADKYVICNGDEGDPGAFMDRMLMESFPYRIIEGMAIAASAVGAREGYFYIREEYPLAVQRIRDAIRQCEERGFLGDDILGTGVQLHLSIMEGAGAFVCGEETALLTSIEGNRGTPRLRPPFPADSGLWGKPTLVNNVETYALVPWIFRNGADAFAALGTETSKGTKVFSLAGKIKRGGLIEVPMGVTIHEIVSEIGGGIKDGGRFKAVQIGGPSGGCIPAELADTPVDYEALTGVGAIMGSGGLVVLDQSDCMVDMARYFLSFTQDQSCGKCTYCRVGTRRMLDVLNRLCEGDGKPGDLDTLEHLSHAVHNGSLCGLGKTAPNPVLSTLRYFRSEYEAHLEGRCPAGKCKALITYRVTDTCIGCTLCAQRCPVEAIPFAPYEKHEIDVEKCTCCDMCRIKCPEEAIQIV